MGSLATLLQLQGDGRGRGRGQNKPDVDPRNAPLHGQMSPQSFNTATNLPSKGPATAIAGARCREPAAQSCRERCSMITSCTVGTRGGEGAIYAIDIIWCNAMVASMRLKTSLIVVGTRANVKTNRPNGRQVAFLVLQGPSSLHAVSLIGMDGSEGRAGRLSSLCQAQFRGQFRLQRGKSLIPGGQPTTRPSSPLRPPAGPLQLIQFSDQLPPTRLPK